MNDGLYWVDPDGTAHERCQWFYASTGETVEFDPGDHPELRWQRESVAYFCPECGDIWERLVLIDSRAKSRAFEVVIVACLKHYDAYEIPGSRLAGRLEGLLALMPAGVLQLELTAHLQHAERESDFGRAATKTGTDGG